MQKVNQFYENVDSYKTIGHPGFEFERSGDKSKIISITHHKKNSLFNKSMIVEFKPLKKNPDPNDKEKSYVSPFPLTVKTKQLKHKINNWEFSSEDYPTIEKIKSKKSK